MTFLQGSKRLFRHRDNHIRDSESKGALDEEDSDDVIHEISFGIWKSQVESESVERSISDQKDGVAIGVTALVSHSAPLDIFPETRLSPSVRNSWALTS